MEKLPVMLMPVKTGMRLVKFPEVLYAKAENGYVRMKLTNGDSVLVTGKLKRLQSLLPTPAFFRVHHSWLVNLNHAAELLVEDSAATLLIGGEKIPVSRDKRAALLELFYRL